MPRSKKVLHSDCSDSHSNEQPPAKRAKTEKQRLSSGVKTEDGTVFDLDRYKRVTVREFKGKLYIDIREFYEQNGKQLPGKKGISLQPEQWRKLLSMTDDINAALAEH
ncbi:RNA polymerase II transcriptional coactivator KIWI [Pseudolycoriella hygida]|uniref:RNA polymerase II transcriptional coactivator KIWI n=1 Tax=Pseudolycoriella hygida TaxID=35572 RepID=A0A9Q0S4F1_9DIPT|nr:RNA polymerase II transcriptional coactivator KIWI [Pseudolycoriella hygida]